MTVRGPASYAAMFDRLEQKGEGAFVPFVVLGDPDPETSLELLLALARAGADALELGLPFSDPIADGPVIQAAASRALDGGVRIGDCWTILAAVRKECPDTPMGLLVYANLVVRQGVSTFYRRAAEAGVDSVLVADAPIPEVSRFEAAARQTGLAPILIAPPNASEETLSTIASRSQGYVYVVSRPGVTGADQELRSDSRELLTKLRTLGSAPPLLGFGISKPEHVRDAIALGAAGAISGSAVVSHIPQFIGARDDLITALRDFVRDMKAATVADIGTGIPNSEHS